MKNLKYSIEIAAAPQKVWEIMLNPTTYQEWVNVSWPGAYYEGNWKKGENVRFLSPGQGGTLANLVECKPAEHILAKHIAVITSKGTEDRESPEAKTWIGTTEAYTFKNKNGKTELTVEMETTPEWESMFPKAGLLH